MLTENTAAPLILIVEDDGSHAELIRRSFESSPEEYRLHVAEILHDARQVMDLHTPSLVLTDYRLPDGDGCDLVKMVNEVCPVVMMTSQGNEQLAVTAMKAGIMDYVVKSEGTLSTMPHIAQRAMREWALIQEHKRVEKEIHRREQEFRALAENSPDTIGRYDIECRRLYANPAFARLAGVPAEALLGKTPTSYNNSPQASAYEAKLREVMESGMEGEHEYEWPDHEGKMITSLIWMTPERDLEGRVVSVLSVGRDITERRMMQNELIKNQKLESLGVLAGGIAHDFNNILTGILGNISFARVFLDDSHRAAKILLEAEKASERAADLARQLLTFAKGGRPLKKTASAGEIIAASASFILRGTNVSSVIEVADNLHPIEVDESQINQVFNNIIINAVQAMPEGGTITVVAENTLLDSANMAFAAPGKYVRVSFTDSGCGMSDDIRKRIFEPYFTTKPRGNGLGLASAYSIIAKHGGHICVRSTPGSGTTFEVLLPASNGKVVETEADRVITKTGEQGGGSLLVMDDEEILRSLIGQILEELGYHARTCINGEEAIALFKAARDAGTPFLAVIMDLTIPGGMGGKEAARHLLNIDPDSRLIVSSGYSDDPVMAEYANYGFSAAIVKPFTLSKMAQVLRTLNF